MRPEDALEAARAAAAERRAAGGYADDLRAFQVEPGDAITTEKLLEWSLIEPDQRDVYSTRRLGAPITGAKRALLKLLRQYHNQLTGQQTRFNHHLTVYASSLEDRITELEARVAELEERLDDGRPPAP